MSSGSTGKSRSVQTVSLGKLCLLLPLAIIARLWAASLRMEATPRFLDALSRQGPHVFLLWHNRLFIIAEINRRFRRPHSQHPMHGLISASKDGAWLAAFFKLVGIQAIRGSSSWRGVEALRDIIRIVTEGSDIGITPDGPRGPCYTFHAGALLAARKSGVPLVLMGIDWQNASRLKSWDGFYLPKPFSKIKLDAIVIEPKRLRPDTSQETSATNTEALQELLQQLNPDRIPHPRAPR